MIQFEQGCTYDVAHLKPFDLQLALSGHPLASRRGESIRLFRSMSSDRYNFDYWDADDRSWISQFNLPTERLALELRLAPLAVKDGKPLHVGDEVELCIPGKRSPQSEWAIEWRKHVVSLGSLPTVLQGWQWPKE